MQGVSVCTTAAAAAAAFCFTILQKREREGSSYESPREFHLDREQALAS